MASRCLDAGDVDVTRGSMEYDWKIPHFFSQKQKYKSCRSREFEFVGAKWQLFLKSSDSLQLNIIKTECGYLDLRVNYTIGIKGLDGTLYKSSHGVKNVQSPDVHEPPVGVLHLSDLIPDKTKTAAQDDQYSNIYVPIHVPIDVSPVGSYSNFYEPPVAYLRPSDMLLDKAKTAAQDVLTVFCNLSVRQEYCERTTADSTTQTEISDDIDRLRRNLEDLLSSGEDSDVVMKVGDREFRAHRAILRARSTVFASMFGHDTKERNSGTVDITDCDPHTFEQFLLHVYTGKVGCLSSENVCHLYQVADKYDIQDLKTKCVEYMEKNFSADTFCDVISLALRHKESELIENATQFFMKNVEKILITVKWLSFLKENPVEANELTIKAVNCLVRGREYICCST